MTRNRTAILLATVITLVSLSACTPQGSPQPTAGGTTAGSAQPTLLTWTQAASSSPVTDALVAGKLAVNETGCVVIGSAILLAPPGSSVLADGSGIGLAGRGDYRFGQSVENLRGGYGDIAGTAADPDGIAGCRSHASPEQEYAIVWGS